MYRFSLIFTLAMITGCDLLVADTGPHETGSPTEATGTLGSGSDTNATDTEREPEETGGGEETTTEETEQTGETEETEAGPSYGWSVASSPCPGYRTETLYEDLDGGAWLGCGSDTGVWHAGVLGGAFSAVGGLEGFHLNDVERGPDGLLWLAGGESATGNDALVYALDTTSMQLDTRVSYSGSSPFMRLADAENIAISTDGAWVIADSTTSGTFGFSVDGGATFLENDTLGRQMMDLQPWSFGFAAAGSTIAAPPTLFFSADPNDPTSFEVIELGYFAYGALEALTVLSDDRIVTVGFNDGDDVPVMIVLDGDRHDAASYLWIDLLSLGVPENVKMFDVAFDSSGRWGVAVGEDLKEGGGYAVISSDGGLTWRQASQSFPAGLQSAISQGEGRFVVAGGEGDLWYGLEE